MDAEILAQLNSKQREAVESPPAHMLILAGAGSGKTRVLVHRIAWLMAHTEASPFSILAVTFTNKAAYEMRGRIEALGGMPIHGMWVGTFHGLAHRFLRTHWKEANLPESFQILDADDQSRLIRRIHKTMDLDETKWPPKQSQWFINQQKEEGRRARHAAADANYYTEVMAKVYLAYEEICERSGLVDFGELLLRSLEVLKKNETIRAHYQQRFRHILVDEFQDTNTIQYLWLKQLAGSHTCMMAVGDDDQSIYSWRGAKIQNILSFDKDFSPVKTIRLEQNYRSTQTILNAANAVIENNTNRLGKKLWTDSGQGELITLYSAFNEMDEAYYIVSRIQDWVNGGNRRDEVAILYRSNAQSRVLEEALLRVSMPYRIYGGQKFYERAEIKDALAYLRLLGNRQDDASFERVVNFPTRGIGDATLNIVRDQARIMNVSLWQSANDIVAMGSLSARAKAALEMFLTLIDQAEKETSALSLGEQTDHILTVSGLLEHYRKDKTEKGLSRVENLEELVSATERFSPEDTEMEEGVRLSPLAAFLSHVALETGESQADEHEDAVNLMTLHAAKGLEFPLVFLAGMEENLFPHRMSIEEANGLEEERRLCYVGMTRAMKKLYLTHAEIRNLHGREQYHTPSRFIAEIPETCLDTVRPQTKIYRPNSFNRESISRDDSYSRFNPRNHTMPKVMPKGTEVGETGLEIGQRVNHKKFGTGIIVNFEGHSQHARIQVKFDRAGTKWLVASYAKLESP